MLRGKNRIDRTGTCLKCYFVDKVDGMRVRQICKMNELPEQLIFY
jgi:hypothetical protein